MAHDRGDLPNGVYLRSILQAKKLSSERLAKRIRVRLSRLNFDVKTVRKVLSGTRHVDQRTFEDIAEVIGLGRAHWRLLTRCERFLGIAIPTHLENAVRRLQEELYLGQISGNDSNGQPVDIPAFINQEIARGRLPTLAALNLSWQDWRQVCEILFTLRLLRPDGKKILVSPRSTEDQVREIAAKHGVLCSAIQSLYDFGSKEEIRSLASRLEKIKFRTAAEIGTPSTYVGLDEDFQTALADPNGVKGLVQAANTTTRSAVMQIVTRREHLVSRHLRLLPHPFCLSFPEWWRDFAEQNLQDMEDIIASLRTATAEPADLIEIIRRNNWRTIENLIGMDDLLELTRGAQRSFRKRYPGFTERCLGWHSSQ